MNTPFNLRTALRIGTVALTLMAVATPTLLHVSPAQAQAAGGGGGGGNGGGGAGGGGGGGDAGGGGGGGGGGEGFGALVYDPNAPRDSAPPKPKKQKPTFQSVGTPLYEGCDPYDPWRIFRCRYQ